MALGGGAESMTKLPNGLDILASNPVYTTGSPATGWYANAKNNTDAAITLTSYAICVPRT
jgi:hypothetical protein